MVEGVQQGPVLVGTFFTMVEKYPFRSQMFCTSTPRFPMKPTTFRGETKDYFEFLMRSASSCDNARVQGIFSALPSQVHRHVADSDFWDSQTTPHACRCTGEQWTHRRGNLLPFSPLQMLAPSYCAWEGSSMVLRCDCVDLAGLLCGNRNMFEPLLLSPRPLRT